MYCHNNAFCVVAAPYGEGLNSRCSYTLLKLGNLFGSISVAIGTPNGVFYYTLLC